jgi:hypothetical protein
MNILGSPISAKAKLQRRLSYVKRTEKNSKFLPPSFPELLKTQKKIKLTELEP